MSTWEERMAERAAVRRGLREAEAWANDGGPPLIAGFEQSTSIVGGPAVVWSGPCTLVFLECTGYVISGGHLYHSGTCPVHGDPRG